MLTPAEQYAVKMAIIGTSKATSFSVKEFVEGTRFVTGRVCPHCGSINVVRNGKRKDGTQRYICKDCGKSFICTSNSIVSGTRKDMDTWDEYIDCMMMGSSLRVTAAKCNISLKTAFVWRHKILDTLQTMANSVHLEGLIEADETFFSVSYKGNHSKSSFVMPRAPINHNTSEAKKRGLSKDKVCVPCAVSRNGLSIAKISNLSRVKVAGLEGVFSGRIAPHSNIVTDSASAYKKFSKNNDLILHQIPSGKHTLGGIYNLAHINSYHSRIKAFMFPFRGVSTKYLNNYLIWNNYVNYSKGSFEHKKQELLSFVFCEPKTLIYKEISKREHLPILV